MSLTTDSMFDEMYDNETTAADWMSSMSPHWTTDLTTPTMAAMNSAPTSSTARPTTAAPREKPCSVWARPPCDPAVIAVFDIVRYAPHVAYAVGIPGSLLTITILIRMRPFNSSSIWLLFLSSVDFISLGARAIVNYMLLYYGSPAHVFETWSCRLFAIVTFAGEYSSYFLLVGLTVERLIAVWFPLKMSTWCTVPRAIAACLTIVTLNVGVNMHYVVTLIYSKWAGGCFTKKKYRTPLRTDLVLYLETTIAFTIPIFSLLILNLLISIRLMQARRTQKQMSSDQNAKEKSKQQKQINRMLLAATLWFFTLGVPHMLFNYTFMHWDDPNDPDISRLRIVCTNLFPIMRLFNHAGNFVLYVIAARKFRGELIKLVTCGRYKGLFQRNVATGSKYISDTKMTNAPSSTHG